MPNRRLIIVNFVSLPYGKERNIYCRFSKDKGYDGYVAFDSKTKLIQHYQDSLGAKWFKGTRMYIDSFAAKKLIDQYFKI